MAVVMTFVVILVLFDAEVRGGLRCSCVITNTILKCKIIQSQTKAIILIYKTKALMCL
jgi:hypothetical protein